VANDSLAEDLTRSTTGGLTSAEAAARLIEVGANVLPEARATPWWERVLCQLHNPIIYILMFALAFDAAVWTIEGMSGWPIESIAILVILAFNTIMGVWQEYRAEDALARLKELAAPNVWVRRDGRLAHVPAAQLVPGDLVRVESGDRVPADGELTGEQGLMLDESMLTGESVPVERAVGEEVYSGTLAVRGLAWLVVTRTGLASAMGRIAGMLANVEIEGTPLERRMTHFGHRIARWVAALAVVLVVAGVGIEGIDRIDEALLFAVAVAVAVAAVPEGLPAVLTLTLLVVGTRGLGPLSGLLLGSISRRLLFAARLPLVVVPRRSTLNPPALTRILVGVDCSPVAQRVLSWSAGFCSAVGVPATIVRCTDPGCERPPGHVERVEDRVRSDTEQALEPFRDLGVEYTIAVAHCDPRVALPQTARTDQAGLIVIGTRGEGQFSGLGGTASYLARHSPSPLAVIP
jgi:nucleotide-binding universal stress UspA family protein